jgi:hypothetical protein
MIIDPDTPGGKTVNQIGSTLDIAPTLLPFLGYRANEYGLGKNLLAKNLKTSEIEYIQKRIVWWLDDLRALWSFPKIEKAIHIDPDNEEVKIDDRTFKIPIAIQIKDDMQTVLRFEFSMPDFAVDLMLHLDQLAGDPYLLIEKCESTNKVTLASAEATYCLVTETNAGYKSVPIPEAKSMSVEDILEFVEKDSTEFIED